MRKTLLFILLFCTSAFSQEVNHAPFTHSDQYSLKAEKFIQNNLLNEDGYYSLAKIKAFSNRLLMEKDFIMQQMYETTIIEEIELRIVDGKDAVGEAVDELNKEKSDYAFLFDKFLLPNIDKLIELVEEDASCSTKCDGIVDEMIIGYSAIFSPELFRSYLPFDVAAMAMFKSFNGFDFPRESSSYIEANNLSVPSTLAKQISHCLQEKVKIDSFLNQQQINRLQDCNFDISKLNPIRSALWNKDAPNATMLKEKSSAWKYFPKEDTVVDYKKLRFSGFGSPKFSVSFKDNGVKRKLKVKLGHEVHTDPVLSALGKMLGLNQDNSVYREKLVVRFKSKKKYDRFLSQMVKKYTDRFRNSLIKEEHRGGEVYATFRYVQLEANKENIVKLNAIDQSGWDHLNRREFRGMLLWFAWVNLRDTRNGNWRVQLVKDGDKITPQISQQDVGQGLMGSQAFKKNPLEIIPNALGRTHLNEFEKSIIRWNDKNIRVQWTDTLKNPDTFSTTTYNDLKWMARNIAKLTKRDIEYALSLSGLTEVEQTLFVAKLINRRNEFVTAFDLKSEFDLIENIDIDNYNVPGVVKNGQITKASLKNSGRYQSKISSLYHLSKLFAAGIPLDAVGNGLVANFGKEFGLDGDVPLTEFSKNLGEKTKIFASPGLLFKLTRGVQDMRFQQFEDKSQRFYTVDRMSIEIDLRAGVVQNLMKQLPFTLQAELKVLKLDFEHFAPAETVRGAIRAPFRIPMILSRLNEYLAYGIKSGEIFNFSTAHGIGLRAELDFKKVVRFGSEISYIASTPTYFHRNYFGELEIYKDTKTETSIKAYVKAGIGHNLFFIPFMGIEFESIKIDGKSMMYKLWSKDKEFLMQSPSIAVIRDKFEKRILDAIINQGYKRALPLMRLEYDMDYQVKAKSVRFFAFIWSKRKVAEYSRFDVTLANNKEKHYHRFVRRKESHTGSPTLAAGLGGLIYFKGNQEIIETQLDEDNPWNFVVIQNIYNYKKKIKRSKLSKYIRKLNKSFSLKPTKPFFSIKNLPPAHDVSLFKKVLAHNRIFYFGDKLFQRLAKLSSKKLKQLGENLVKSVSYDPINPSESDRSYAQSILDKLVDSSHYLSDGKFEKFSKTFSKMIQLLDVKRRGMGPTLTIFKESELFSTGEIYGLLESYTTMSDKHTNSLNRRYTGTSFGKYKRIPPVWKYVNNNPVFLNVLPEVYNTRDMKDVFGVLPSGEPVFR